MAMTLFPAGLKSIEKAIIQSSDILCRGKEIRRTTDEVRALEKSFFCSANFTVFTKF